MVKGFGNGVKQECRESIPNGAPASLSAEELNYLCLPKSMAGMAILDLGCDTDFFMEESARRGAVRVVGIERDTILPNETFDLIYLLLGLESEKNPTALFNWIAEHLKPDGRLILRCCSFEEAGQSRILTGSGWFAADILRRFAWRRIARLPQRLEDSHQEWVFHCPLKNHPLS